MRTVFYANRKRPGEAGDNEDGEDGDDKESGTEEAVVDD